MRRKALLVRVGIDSTAGQWNAPVDSKTGRFVYVPIPEEPEGIRRGYIRPYKEVIPALESVGVSLPSHLKRQYMHLDPDFSTLTYGDQGGRARCIWKLGKGDMLVFYAGLRALNKVKKELVYALIGLYVIKEIVLAKRIPKSKWGDNAHTRRIPDDSDIVVRAIPKVSGRLERCILVGEYRDGAYRVKNEILKAWGNLDVKDGFLQRSAYLPCFLDPERFYRWFKKSAGKLLRMNN